MSQQTDELEQMSGVFGVIAIHSLGTGNMGNFGPKSNREAELAQAQYGDPEYELEGMDGSSCMDDRGEGLGVQLPGNRAHSEVISGYMDKSLSPQPISFETANKTRELVAKGKIPKYHGDKASGLKGCLAVSTGRTALEYLGENSEKCATMALDRLRLLGNDRVNLEQLIEMAQIGKKRAADESLWDADTVGIINSAVNNGAEYEEFLGAHHTAGPREDFSPHGFDNGRFRHDHRTDEGHPLGALSLTYGHYAEQLKEEGFSEQEITKKISGVVLYSMAILKLACKAEAIDVFVGYGVVD